MSSFLNLVIPETDLQLAEDLMDLKFLQHFLQKGLEERIICKTIRAFNLFQERINEQNNNSDYLDNEDILIASGTFLNSVSSKGLTKNHILPMVFQAVKKESNSSLELLMKDLEYSILLT